MSRRPRRRRQNGRGTLFILAGLLVSSALIRIGDDAGQALARAPDAEAVVSAPPEGALCKTPEDLRAMLKAFASREDRLTAREAALRDRMRALQLADEEVSAKLAELKKAETALRETMALAETASENDLDRLTKVYESMKPKQAAALFEEMDPSFAAGFLGRMRPEAAANIMAGLSPGVARAFSVVLAGRNAKVPKE